MITLITGTPGAGKTAWTVQELTRLPSQRKIYVHGIPELKIAHEPIYCTSNLCEHCQSLIQLGHDGSYMELPDQPGQALPLVEQWPEWATDGSLIVIDEVQRIWRPSSSGKLPDEIAALETHRHHGLDFWLISQGPHLFHSNVRLLIGKHIHLVSKWNGRSEYEWPECRQNVTSRGDAVTRPYTLPRKIFHLYKSSSLHIKQNHRKPLAFYAFFFSLFLLVLVFYLAWQRVMANIPDDIKSVTDTPGQTAPAGGSGGAVTDLKSTVNIMSPVGAEYPDFTPIRSNLPESAPAYSHIIKVTQIPRLIACVNTPETGCKCYSKQAAPYPTSYEFCLSFIKGEYFNPYKS